MRNKEGNPSPLTPIFISFGKTELKLPLRMKADVYIVGFHCCDNAKPPLLGNVLSEDLRNGGKAALSVLSCPQFYSMYTSSLRTVKD